LAWVASYISCIYDAVAVCCSVLRCVAVCCSVLQCVALQYTVIHATHCNTLQQSRHISHIHMTQLMPTWHDSIICDIAHVLETMGSAWHTAAALIHMYSFHICISSFQICISSFHICTYSFHICIYSFHMCIYSFHICIYVYQGSSSMPPTTHSLTHTILNHKHTPSVGHNHNTHIHIWNKYMCIKAAEVCHALPIVTSTLYSTTSTLRVSVIIMCSEYRSYSSYSHTNTNKKTYVSPFSRQQRAAYSSRRKHTTLHRKHTESVVHHHHHHTHIKIQAETCVS